MSITIPEYFRLSSAVSAALSSGQPVVALESTVITHGLPYPENLALARDLEAQVRLSGAVPATIAVLDGQVCVGVDDAELERLATGHGMRKISRRDFGPAILAKASGGTTVAGTMLAAQRVGIQVFATGGIGGVHRSLPGQPAFDISPDLLELAHTPMIVVCAGAKAILDLPATLEVLETQGVPVVGYQTAEFPAFYCRESGLPTSARADSPEEVARLASIHWGLGFPSALLVTVPIPAAEALPREPVESAIRTALEELSSNEIRGQAVTPFLLGRVKELTGGASLRANLALLRNNAQVAAQIAQALVQIAGTGV